MAIDLQESIISHDRILADLETSKIIDTKLKLNNTLPLEVGLVYMCTYNGSIKGNKQKCIYFDLPDE